MTIDEYTKKHNLPEMRVMGETEDYRYYIKKNVSSTMQLGIPMVVAEDKKADFFSICNANEALDLISYFSMNK